MAKAAAPVASSNCRHLFELPLERVLSAGAASRARRHHRQRWPPGPLRLHADLAVAGLERSVVARLVLHCRYSRRGSSSSCAAPRPQSRSLSEHLGGKEVAVPTATTECRGPGRASRCGAPAVPPALILKDVLRVPLGMGSRYRPRLAFQLRGPPAVTSIPSVPHLPRLRP